MERRRIAFIGDIHGCIDELKELIDLIKSHGVSEIWHCGDLVDRGPDSGGVIQYCIDNNMPGVLGNHDAVIVNLWDMAKAKPEFKPRKSDKAKTFTQLNDERIEYLRTLPLLKVFDDIKTVLVHGGLVNGVPFNQQPVPNVCRLQLIHPDHPGQTRWFNKDKKGITEDEYRAQGWERWYRLWEGEYNVVFGHSGFVKPLVYTNSKGAKCIGIDTGCCFGRTLTALIMPDMTFLEVPARNGLEDHTGFIPEYGGNEN